MRQAGRGSPGVSASSAPGWMPDPRLRSSAASLEPSVAPRSASSCNLNINNSALALVVSFELQSEYIILGCAANRTVAMSFRCEHVQTTTIAG